MVSSCANNNVDFRRNAAIAGNGWISDEALLTAKSLAKRQHAAGEGLYAAIRFDGS